MFIGGALPRVPINFNLIRIYYLLINSKLKILLRNFMSNKMFIRFHEGYTPLNLKLHYLVFHMYNLFILFIF